jgi:hypothetical protein
VDQNDNPRTTRRLLVTGGALAAAAVAADAVASPKPAEAATGDPVRLGNSNSSTRSTAIHVQMGTVDPRINAGLYVASDVTALSGYTNGTGYGISALSTKGTAVLAQGGPTGVWARGFDRGLYADGHDTGVMGASTGGGTGVLGRTDSATTGAGVRGMNTAGGIGVAGSTTSGGPNGAGVSGTSSGEGPGVRGQSSKGDGVSGQASDARHAGVRGVNTGMGYGVLGQSYTGPGVVAKGSTGPGLRVEGRAEFSLSGGAIVRALASSVTVYGLRLSRTSLVIATLQEDRPGVWVVSAVLARDLDGFTIRLNIPVLAETRVGWFVVN